MKKMLVALVALLALIAVGCTSAADTTSENISTAADNFEIQRRIVFFNGITDKYLLVVEGRCSIKADGVDKQLEVTCKVGEKEYKKHFLGLSDNVSYFVEQVEGADVSPWHYRVMFRPEQIVPDIDIQTSGEDK